MAELQSTSSQTASDQTKGTKKRDHEVLSDEEDAEPVVKGRKRKSVQSIAFSKIDTRDSFFERFPSISLKSGFKYPDMEINLESMIA
jgi:hypothetical protein